MLKVLLIVSFIWTLGLNLTPVLAAGTTIDNLNEYKTNFNNDKLTINARGSSDKQFLFVQVDPQIKGVTNDLDDKLGMKFNSVTITDPEHPSNSVTLPIDGAKSFQAIRPAGLGLMMTPPNVTPPSLSEFQLPNIPRFNLNIPADAWIWLKNKIDNSRPIGIKINRQFTGIESGTTDVVTSYQAVFDKLTRNQGGSIICGIDATGKTTNCEVEVRTLANSIDDLYKANPIIKPGFDISKMTGPGGAPVPTATPCTGANCSSGGGIPCDVGRGPAFKTAIGCIHTNPVEFVKDFIKFAVAISGGLAFLMMLLGAFQMLTSAGNPDALNSGRERLTSAIIGLLFVIFATLLMQVIGISILNIPGFKP